MKSKISVVITAVDGEEKYLPLCLSSVKNIASEIIIVDMSGGKKITEAAKKYKAKIFVHEFVNYVEPVRNFGISKATGEWILILDPDEEIKKELKERLNEIVENNEADYVRIPRENIVFGKILHHSRWWPDYNIRFFKKGKVTWDEVIHSVPMTEGNGIDLEAKNEFAITHHHYETIEQFIERMNRYTSVQAKLKAKDYNFSPHDLIAKPSAEFLSRYFAGQGYRDGIFGFALSALQAFSELVVYLKIWQMQGFKDEEMQISNVIGEIAKQKRELNYWENDVIIKENGGIIPRIRRKFKV
ncbi:MAG TPA: glycosyltransferase family 2 protein [Patescibacteria group bacterium]|nr:glycosyltransferase family 2 protein [Patescibacteria group bacterium]